MMRRMTLGERIRAARLAKPMSQIELGKAMKVSRAAISQWESDETSPHKRLNDLALALSVRPEWLSFGSGQMTEGMAQQEPARNKVVAGGNQSVSDDLRVSQPFPNEQSTRNLPIRGYAKGGEEGFFIDNGELGGYTMRPHVLEGVADAYAVEVWDTSMEPALEHGWLCWVNPRKPVKIGDRVVVQLNDGQALVKKLIRRSTKEIILRQFNPPKDIPIKAGDVKAIHLIVGNLSVAV